MRVTVRDVILVRGSSAKHADGTISIVLELDFLSNAQRAVELFATMKSFMIDGWLSAISFAMLLLKVK